MTLQCARVAAAPWMAWPRLRAVEPSARPPRRLAGRASGRGTACFASGASGLEAAYPLLCCLASASSVAAARLQQRRLDSAEERPPPWQTVALSKAATALSILPFVNFLVRWTIPASVDDASAETNGIPSHISAFCIIVRAYTHRSQPLHRRGYCF